MRRILIEHARRRGRIKRGGNRARSALDDLGDVADLDRVAQTDRESFLAFEGAFRRLQEHEPRAADVARLRFFAGLSVPEAARALGVSERTVNNRWSYARAWLARALGAGPPSAGKDPSSGSDPHAPPRQD
jgi:RNA polymerase sigma factor (TIGR02999 family)